MPVCEAGLDKNNHLMVYGEKNLLNLVLIRYVKPLL